MSQRRVDSEDVLGESAATRGRKSDRSKLRPAVAFGLGAAALAGAALIGGGVNYQASMPLTAPNTTCCPIVLMHQS